MIARTHHRHSFGLTLIEMVVALVLASMMTAGILQVISVVSIESNQLRSEQTDYVAAGILADRLRRDLINARGLVADKNSVTLAGLIPETNLPGRIRYQRIQIGANSVLVRQVGRKVQLCWVGFGSFNIESFDEIDAETPVPELAGGLPPMPTRLRITLNDHQGHNIVREVIIHHAE